MIVIALLTVIASCLLFGRHVTLVLIGLFLALALFWLAVWRVREWCEDRASRRAYWRQVNEHYVAQLKAKYVEPPKAPARPMTRQERRDFWVVVAATLLIMIAVGLRPNDRPGPTQPVVFTRGHHIPEGPT